MSADVRTDRREPQTGLCQTRRREEASEREIADRLGTLAERQHADGYDVDAILAASNEFRELVPGGFRHMTRGEAIHIARALRAIAETRPELEAGE